MPPIELPAGATAAQYVAKKYGVATRTTPLQTIAVLTTATKLCSNNPRRMELELFNFGNANVYVLNGPQVSVASGILLSPLGGSVIISVDEDGELVCYDWWAISGAAGNNAGVLEIETL